MIMRPFMIIKPAHRCVHARARSQRDLAGAGDRRRGRLVEPLVLFLEISPMTIFPSVVCGYGPRKNFSGSPSSNMASGPSPKAAACARSEFIINPPTAVARSHSSAPAVASASAPALHYHLSC